MPNTILSYNKSLKETARHLRNNMTDAEKMLWSRIRGKQISGIQFYRQKPIAHYIVDFFAPKARLVIEGDGSQHKKTKYKKKGGAPITRSRLMRFFFDLYKQNFRSFGKFCIRIFTTCFYLLSPKRGRI